MRTRPFRRNLQLSNFYVIHYCILVTFFKFILSIYFIFISFYLPLFFTTIISRCRIHLSSSGDNKMLLHCIVLYCIVGTNNYIPTYNQSQDCKLCIVVITDNLIWRSPWRDLKVTLTWPTSRTEGRCQTWGCRPHNRLPLHTRRSPCLQWGGVRKTGTEPKEERSTV